MQLSINDASNTPDTYCSDMFISYTQVYICDMLSPYGPGSCDFSMAVLVKYSSKCYSLAQCLCRAVWLYQLNMQ